MRGAEELPEQGMTIRASGRKRGKSTPKLTDQHNAGGPDKLVKRAAAEGRRVRPRTIRHHDPTGASPEPVNEYEKKRQERIQMNQRMLQELGLNRLAQEVVQVAIQEIGQANKKGTTCQVRRRAPRRTGLPGCPVSPRVTRRSGRLNRRCDEGEAAGEEGVMKVPREHDKAVGALLTQEEYFQWQGKELKGTRVLEGGFKGWVNPEICERYGIADNPSEAWEKNGGGSFTYKIHPSKVPRHLKARGWSNARAFSSTQLRKNPNAYFYRHVAPHEQQAHGLWSEEEHNRFLEVARTYGVGGKWGLFASYIPQRVGYQCSSYYRDVIIPQGLIVDLRFRLTRQGRAVYVG